jgi:cytochrome b
MPPTADNRGQRRAPAEGPGRQPRVMVWDPVVRLVHWIVAFGCIANLSFLRNADSIHEYVGYTVSGAVLVRLIWGVYGSHHARYADFVPRPAQLLNYVRLLLRGREPRYLGHNPAGAAMMITLVLLVIACALSGWMMGLDRFWGESWVEYLHESAANLIMIGAILHVAGAILESVRHRENLPLSMVTGRKRAPAGSDVANASAADRR